MPFKKNTAPVSKQKNMSRSSQNKMPKIPTKDQAHASKQGVPKGVKSASTGSTNQSAGGGVGPRTPKGRHKGPAVPANTC